MALLALAAAPQQPAAPPTAPQTLRVTVGTHLPFELSSPATRVAVGNPDVLSYELLDERELLLLGQTTGRTSLLVWDASNRPQQFAVLVQPDLTLLAQALDELAPGVIVESALDRDAVVLRGLVADVRVYAAVESTARAWLDAGATAAAPSNALPGVPLEDLPGAPQTAQSAGRVINLLTIIEQPRTLEQRITDAMDDAGYSDVRTSRVLRGAYPDDSLDAFVLEGSVPDQAALTRALLLASATLDPALVSSGLEVLADESGALSQGNNQLGQQQNQQFAAQGQGGVFQGGGGQGNQVNNRIQQNLGRATAVSAAGGRVLSFLEVVDLPQVRIDVEIYEVDRTKLESFDVSLEAIGSDFAQGALSPLGSGLSASPLVGDVSPTDAQGVLDVIDGSGGAGFQVAGSKFAVSATLEALETRGYARSVARPSLTVLSGELAQFQVGGEIPIPSSFATTVGDGPEGVFNSVDFQPFGVRLVCRPLVEPDGQITLDLVPEIVTPDTELTTAIRDATGTDPLTVGFDSRALRTTARVERGGALVIGGLIQRSENGSSSGVPGLSDLPLIGWLFGRESQQSAETELVLVVAPARILKPRPEARRWAHADPVALVVAHREVPEEEETEENTAGGGNSQSTSGITPSEPTPELGAGALQTPKG